MSGTNRPKTPTSVTSKKSQGSGTRPTSSAVSGRSRDVASRAIYEMNGPTKINALDFLRQVKNLDAQLRLVEGKLRAKVQEKFSALLEPNESDRPDIAVIQEIGKKYDKLFESFSILKDNLGQTDETGLKQEVNNMKGKTGRIKDAQAEVDNLKAYLEAAEVFFSGCNQEGIRKTAELMDRVTNINTMDTLLNLSNNTKKEVINEHLGELKYEDILVKQVRRAINPDPKTVTFSYDSRAADERSGPYRQPKEGVIDPSDPSVTTSRRP